jgi:hypothetical protein
MHSSNLSGTNLHGFSGSSMVARAAEDFTKPSLEQVILDLWGVINIPAGNWLMQPSGMTIERYRYASLL